MNAVQEKTGILFDFPIIADLDRKVAHLYGLIAPAESKTETSRCVFVIDDKQNVRATIYYPLTTGRNIEEILRLVKALQLTDAKSVSTPADWKPGDKVIIPPPQSIEAAEERVKTKGIEVTDWYFSKKSA